MRFQDIISEAKLFLLDRSSFILFKKILKKISQFICSKNISNSFSKSNKCSCKSSASSVKHQGEVNHQLCMFQYVMGITACL